MLISKLISTICIIAPIISAANVDLAIDALIGTSFFGEDTYSYVTNLEAITGIAKQTITQTTDAAKIRFYAKTKDRLDFAYSKLLSAYLFLPDLNEQSLSGFLVSGSHPSATSHLSNRILARLLFSVTGFQKLFQYKSQST